MKKVLIIACAGLITACNCLGQATEKPSFLQKSKNQKTGAWVLAGSGAGLFVAGIIVSVSNSSKSVVNAYTLQSDNTNYTAGTVLLITGAAAALGSIPLFIASSRNKHKAASLSFKNEMAPQLQNSTVFYKPIPSISLKIEL
ncbi:MAG: hypothetical protein ABI666_08630 [Ferruginibacter sp.]